MTRCQSEKLRCSDSACVAKASAFLPRIGCGNVRLVRWKKTLVDSSAPTRRRKSAGVDLIWLGRERLRRGSLYGVLALETGGSKGSCGAARSAARYRARLREASKEARAFGGWPAAYVFAGLKRISSSRRSHCLWHGRFQRGHVRLRSDRADNAPRLSVEAFSF
jgi:hypothetical protein